MSRKTAWFFLWVLIAGGFWPPLTLAAEPRLELWAKNLTHPDLTIRKTAVRKLGELGDAAAVAPLVVLLKDNDPELRRLAAESLAQIKDPGPIEILKEVAKNDNERKVRLAAARAVERLEGIQNYKKEQEEKLEKKKGNHVRQ